MLSFGNTLCAAQRSARPKSSFLFYEKLYTYVSPRVSVYNPSFKCCTVLGCRSLQNRANCGTGQFVTVILILLYNNYIIFLLERRHNDWFLVFTFVGCQLVLNIEKFNWMFTLKGQENLNLKLNLDYIWTKFEGFKVFF